MRSKIFSSLGGVLLFLVLFGAGEWALRLKYGPLEPERMPEKFKEFHEVIYGDLFRKERAGGKWIYRAVREQAAPQTFPAKKPEHAFRVFIIGGSVAMPFSNPQKTRLREFMQSALPGRTLEIVGCGMPGYDSYRESRIQKEVLEHDPDLIILLSGNNESLYPVRVNPALYKMNFQMRKSQIYRRLQKRFFPRRLPRT